MRKYIKPLIPSFLLRLRSIAKDKVELAKIEKIPCDTDLVASASQINLEEIFYSEEYGEEWKEVEREISSLSISDKASGVNPGDRRVLYYLVRHLRPRAVLEIGTDIGASAVHIAAALRMLNSSVSEVSHTLVTVDIRDVNDVRSKPWVEGGSTYSPIDMMNKLGCDEIATFTTNWSLNYFENCEQKFDLIFLDGNHWSSTVYQEIPASLKVLNKGGWILLHDYFPDLKPLWSNKALVPGPYLATNRLQSEGEDIKVLPLGRLPWPTKLNSNVTSLALLGKH